MKERFNAVRVGLFFVLGLILTYAVFLALSRRELHEKGGYRVTAVFSDMSTLSPNNDVRLAGVKIGRVLETNLQDGKGVAVILIDGKYTSIPADSVASISMGNLLGSNFMSIEYGDPKNGILREGGVLQTKPTASIGAVLSQLDSLGRKLNVAADSFSNIGEGPANLFGKLNEMVDRDGPKLDRTIDNLAAITQDIRDGRGTIGKLMSSDEAHTQILAAVEEIRHAAEDARHMIDNANGTLEGIKNGQGVAGKLLYDRETADKLARIIDNLNEFSAKLNSDKGTLGKLAGDDELYRQLRALLSEAQQSLGAMSDSGPISAVGAAANGLF
ncbi:MAG TPA: MlaD family protein [Opitutales bacterium]|nr:MlaD family protein [Opitutales bacterium]